MAMRISTVEILTEKAHFEPQVAVAVAEAIDEAIDTRSRDSQWVTVPILDARLSQLKAELKGDIAAVQVKLAGDIAAVQVKLGSDIAALQVKLGGDVAAVQVKLGGDIAALDHKFSERVNSALYRIFFAIAGQFAALVGVTYIIVSLAISHAAHAPPVPHP